MSVTVEELHGPSMLDDIEGSGMTRSVLIKKIKKMALMRNLKPIKLDALKYVFKLRGDEPPDKSEITGPNGGPIEYTRLDRANRIAAIAEAARKRKSKAEKKAAKNG